MTPSVPLLRTELLGCYSDQDFLAKLHCVRQAFEVGVQGVWCGGHWGGRWACPTQGHFALSMGSGRPTARPLLSSGASGRKGQPGLLWGGRPADGDRPDDQS